MTVREITQIVCLVMALFIAFGLGVITCEQHVAREIEAIKAECY